jgi:hypothetical protein
VGFQLFLLSVLLSFDVSLIRSMTNPAVEHSQLSCFPCFCRCRCCAVLEIAAEGGSKDTRSVAGKLSSTRTIGASLTAPASYRNPISTRGANVERPVPMLVGGAARAPATRPRAQRNQSTEGRHGSASHRVEHGIFRGRNLYSRCACGLQAIATQFELEQHRSPVFRHFRIAGLNQSVSPCGTNEPVMC